MHIQKKLLHLCIVALMYTTSKAQPSINAVIGNIIDQKVDAIVNAANPHLSAGGGVCGILFINIALNLKIKQAPKLLLYNRFTRNTGRCDSAISGYSFELLKYQVTTSSRHR